MRKARLGTSRGPARTGGQKAVGWNCTNSMLATAALARKAIAIPSPVATAGFVVTGYTCAASAHSQPRPAQAAFTSTVTTPPNKHLHTAHLHAANSSTVHHRLKTLSSTSSSSASTAVNNAKQQAQDSTCPAPPVASRVTGATKRVIALAAVFSASTPRQCLTPATCTYKSCAFSWTRCENPSNPHDQQEACSLCLQKGHQ